MTVENATDFQALLCFSRVSLRENFPLESLHFLNTKLQSASVLAHDLPKLADAHFVQDFERPEENLEVVTYNPIYQIRIASSCESLCNAIYGAGEIAAKCIGPRLRPQKPSGFRKFKDCIKNGDLKNVGLGVQSRHLVDRI